MALEKKENKRETDPELHVEQEKQCSVLLALVLLPEAAVRNDRQRAALTPKHGCYGNTQVPAISSATSHGHDSSSTSSPRRQKDVLQNTLGASFPHIFAPHSARILFCLNQREEELSGAQPGMVPGTETVSKCRS